MIGKKSHVYQIGTINSLLEAVYDGDTSMKVLKQHGNFGIGTLDSIDGEMIMYDGICYRADAAGKLHVLPDIINTPFAMVNDFCAEIEFALTAGSYADIEKQISQHFLSSNLVYAIEVRGKFKHLNLRSEHCTCKPYRRLVEILPDLQTNFNLEHTDGVLVGFWFPDYMSQLNVPGFHFHFIDDNRQFGGHVFGFELSEGICNIQTLHGFNLELLRTSEFYQADLNRTSARDVALVEQVRD